MGNLFRSEEMVLCQLFIQPEAAFTFVSELGKIGAVQFRDLNPNANVLQRKFVNEVRRCDEMERRLRYIKSEVKRAGVAMENVLDHQSSAPNQREFIILEALFEKTANDILELSENDIILKSNFLELTEQKQVLEKTQAYLGEEERSIRFADPTQTQGRLRFVAGVIERKLVPGFEQMLWRISRGNVLLRQSELFDTSNDGDAFNKTVFFAFFQGDQLEISIKKVCTGYHATVFQCPSSYDERDEMIQVIRTRLEDMNIVLNQTQDLRQRVLVSVAKHLPLGIVILRKMKAIYHTLNLFDMDISKKCLIGECWVPVNDVPTVRKVLLDGSEADGSTIQSILKIIQHKYTPPTFNRTNKFTRGFQNLIDAYGIASYREANPALYTIITFPFLFSIMFGDFGHGLIMTLFGAWMVFWEDSLQAKRIKSEIWTIFFGGRYIILLMGVFSMYTGFVYNDIFSKSVNIFGSAWLSHYNTSDIMSNFELTLNPSSDDYDNSAYPIGLDPVWQLAKNKIIFLNSYKMKLSIIFGVTHMIFGVCMSIVNIRHFRRSAYIILEFVPQILILVSIFAYLVFMMFFKWVVYDPKSEAQIYTPKCAPSILIMYINMVMLAPKETHVKSENETFECPKFMFESQYSLQRWLVINAILCMVFLLLGKPLYILYTRSRARHGRTRLYVNPAMETTSETDYAAGAPLLEQSSSTHPTDDHHDMEPMIEICIHQAIHTIEFVLSTISHTASYLRLWALSLAHAQLSEVLYNMILQLGLKQTSFKGAVFLAVIFMIWAMFTLAILVMMEGLSAFLHTLRLHWVEFMSKFYSGLGYAFTPFSFQDILEAEEESE